MTINLEKWQKISLEKTSAGLTKVVMGLGWDAANGRTVKKSRGFLADMLFGQEETAVGGGDSIDLDASCLMLDENGCVVDIVYFRNLNATGIRHTGDNRTGVGDGDDEQIIVDLNMVRPNVKYLVFTINSYTGQTFDRVDNAFCVLRDARQVEVARYSLTACKGSHNAMIVSKLYRHNGEWKMHAIGEPVTVHGRTAQDLVPLAQRYL